MVIGLTGGIGSGKSSVADLFSARGAVVLDADAIAHEVTAPGGVAHAAVVARFGSADRAALADIVFTDQSARHDLEAIVHPVVLEMLAERIAAHAGTDAIVVAVVPLLVEVGWQGADVVVVVDCAEEVAVRRLVEQRGVDEADARRRIAAQAPRETRLAVADHVITNDGPREALEPQVARLLSELATLSGARAPGTVTGSEGRGGSGEG